jgi:hypothetical protein
MIKSAFHIPHHVAIRIFQCMAPRRSSAENLGAGGDGFPHSKEKYYKKLRGFPHSCAKVEPYSRFVWANSVEVIPTLLILDGPIIIDSRFRSHFVKLTTTLSCTKHLSIYTFNVVA